MTTTTIRTLTIGDTEYSVLKSDTTGRFACTPTTPQTIADETPSFYETEQQATDKANKLHMEAKSMCDTAFEEMQTGPLKNWRSRLGMSQRSAAKSLGLSLKGYQELERGSSFETGAPMEPDLRTRLACAAIERKLKPI